MSNPSGESQRFLTITGQNMAALLEGTRGRLRHMVHGAIRGSGDLGGQPPPTFIAPGATQPVRFVFRPPVIPTQQHQQHHHHHHQHQSDNQEQSAIIDLGTFLAENSDPPSASSSDASIGGGSGQSGGAAQLGDLSGIQGQMFMYGKVLYKAMEDFLPFLLLIFAKVMYEHRLGILVFIGLFGTFHHVNNKLCKLATLRDRGCSKEHIENIVWLVFFLCLNIFSIYYFFSDQGLYRVLYFLDPDVEELGLGTLLWVTGVTDFVIKFSTVLLKTIVVATPRLILPYSHKGRYYMLVESVSQLYRSLVPVMPWFYFLLDTKRGGVWVSYALVLLYVVAKCFHLLKKLKDLKNALIRFKQNLSYATVPDRSVLESYDNVCPICQDKFNDPVMLNCKHVFCEECVALWFDRDRTCPMCRTAVTDNPLWRDGSTWSGIQVY